MNANTWLPLSTLALMALTACNGGVETTPTGSTSAAATTSGSGGSGSGGAGSAATTGATSGSGGAMSQTLTLTMDSFTVPPGGEVYKCQNFANPFGADVDVSAFESHMAGGSHHLLLFYKDGAANSAEEDCSGLEFAATPYSTQLPDDSVEFPAGVAALVPSTTGFRLQSHYLNTTNKPIEAHVELTFHTVKPETVTAHAGVLFVVDPNFAIKPNSTKIVTKTCTLPYDMNIIKAGSHMHKHGTHFDATIGAETIFETTTWDEPKPALFAPAKAVKGGDTLKFNCTFVNNSPNTLTFGESAETNEMCIFVSSFYPVPDGTTTVGCN